MARYKIDLQQSDDKDLLVEISDQALEADKDRQLLLLDLTASPVALICIDDSARRADQAKC